MDAPQDQGFSVAPTHINGVPLVPSAGAQPYTPPVPVDTPMRLVVNGAVIERSPPVEPAEDPRIEALLDEATYADAYLRMTSSYHTPYEYTVAQREVKKFVANQQRRKETGRLFLEPWEYQVLQRPSWLKDEE